MSESELKDIPELGVLIPLMQKEHPELYTIMRVTARGNPLHWTAVASKYEDGQTIEEAIKWVIQTRIQLLLFEYKSYFKLAPQIIPILKSMKGSFYFFFIVVRLK
jgi:hypothetical protein